MDIKESIVKEIQNLINTIDPAFNVEEIVSLYLKVLKYKLSLPIKDNLKGLDSLALESLNGYFIKDNISSTSIGVFCKKFEQFVKKIYYMLEEGELISSEHCLDTTKLHALLPFLNKLNKVRPIYLDKSEGEVHEIQFANCIEGEIQYKINKETGNKVYLRLYPSSLSFDKYTDVDDKELNEKFSNDFKLHLIKAVILKNEQSHQAPDFPRLKLINNLYSTLIAELWIIDFFKRELTEAIRQVNYGKRDFTNYIESEIEKLKKQSSRFVSLNLKELIERADRQGKNLLVDKLVTSDPRRVRILGQGGSGKTTTLEYLFYRDALKWFESPSTSKLPVLISLANLLENESIVQNISKKINTEISYTEELLETNALSIYLDGVNEIIATRESKKNKLQEISSLILFYPKLSIIISDRYEFDSYQSDMFGVPTYMIQKLNEDQIQEFVEKYCSGHEQLYKHVMERLKSKNGIKELLLRPLVLTRAIEIIKMDDDLPEKEGQIIEKFLDTLLRREKDEKKDPLLNITTFKLLLSYIANYMWIKYDKSNVPIHEFAFNKLLVKASNEFGIERFNAGYITRIGYELEILSKHDDHLQFFHQSYLEFFVKHFLKYQVY